MKKASKSLFINDKHKSDNIQNVIKQVSEKVNPSILENLIDTKQFNIIKPLSESFSNIYKKFEANKPEYINSFNKYLKELKEASKPQFENNNDYLHHIKNTISEVKKITSDEPMYDNLLEAIIEEDELEEQPAYAGSRKDYEKPSLNAIGSGEGNIAHGWGLYYAQDKDVAFKYRDSYIHCNGLDILYDYKINNVEYLNYIKQFIHSDIYQCIKKSEKYILKYANKFSPLFNKYYSIKDTTLKYWKDLLETVKYDEYLNEKDRNKSTQEIKNLIDNLTSIPEDNFTYIIGKGQVHRVELPEDKFLLNEQKPLTKQSKYVKQILEKMNQESEFKGFLDVLRTYYKDKDITGYDIYRKITIYSSPKEASETLYKYGIKGIKYDGKQDGECFVIFNPNDVKVIDKLIKESEEIEEQPAYAGSRVDYDTPSLDAIGSGEGHAAHGWGLYYAQSKDVAKRYREKFITGDSLYDNYSYKGNKELSYNEEETLASIVEIAISENKDIENIIKEKIADYEKTIQVNEENIEDNTEFRQEIINDSKDAINFLKNLNPNDVEINKGQIHKVEVPEDEFLLDEDKDFDEQSEYVQKALTKLYAEKILKPEIVERDKKYNLDLVSGYGKEIYDYISDNKGGKKNASLLLRQYGIKGITYNGRQDGRCYVIFNPDDVKVIDKLIKESVEKLEGSHNTPIYVSNSVYEITNLIKSGNLGQGIRICYDKEKNLFMWADVYDYTHIDIFAYVCKMGYYPESFTVKKRLTNLTQEGYNYFNFHISQIKITRNMWADEDGYNMFNCFQVGKFMCYWRSEFAGDDSMDIRGTQFYDILSIDSPTMIGESKVQDKTNNQAKIDGVWYNEKIIDGLLGTEAFNNLQIGDEVELEKDKPQSYQQSNEYKLNNNFWAWFGDSVVRDGNGNPLVVYHGSEFDIEKFDKGCSGATTGNNYAEVFYFTSNKESAIDYSVEATVRNHESDYYDDDKLQDEKTYDEYEEEIRDRVRENPHINPCFLKMENPFIYDNHGEDFDYSKFYTIQMILQGRNDIDTSLFDDSIWQELSNAFGYYDEDGEFHEDGRQYDGLIIKNLMDDIGDFKGNIDEYIVWNPNQIKSVNNKGNWSLYSDNVNETLNEASELNDNFWKWFNGSKIVDNNGNPMICYHGTPNSFTVFDKALKGTFSHGEGAGVGFWFSTTPVYALNHRNQMSVYLSIKNPKIFKTGKYSHTELEYMRNLYNKEKDYDEKYYIYKLINCISSREDAYEHFLLDLYNSNNQIPINQNFYGDLRDIVKLENPQQAYDNYISKLNSEGYDGIMIVNTSYDTELAKGRNTQIIAFEPNQIKSINNNGNWSDSDDINEDKEVINERLFPEISDDVYNELLNITAPENHKANSYTKWLGNYIKNHKWEGDKDRIKTMLDRHKKLFADNKVKPIMDYKNLDELFDDLSKWENYLTKSEKSKSASKGAIKLATIDGYTIYDIQSRDAARKYGENTKWCVTDSTSDFYFNKYTKNLADERGSKNKSTLLYIIGNDRKFAASYSFGTHNGKIDNSYNWCQKWFDVYNSLDGLEYHYNIIQYENEQPNIEESGDKEPITNVINWIMDKYGINPESVEKELNQLLTEQVAYTGSSEDFDKFSTDKIKSGTGLMEFGWGLYFTAKKKEAKNYRNQVLGRNKAYYKNMLITQNGDMLVNDKPARELPEWNFNLENLLVRVYRNGKRFVNDLKQLFDDYMLKITKYQRDSEEWKQTFKDLQDINEQLKFGKDITFGKGVVYKVEIPDDEYLMVANANPSGQSETVYKALHQMVKDGILSQKSWKKEAMDMYFDLAESLYTKIHGTNMFAKGENYKMASKKLHEYGIKGIKFLSPYDDKTVNYCIFSADDVKTINKDLTEQVNESVSYDNINWQEVVDTYIKFRLESTGHIEPDDADYIADGVKDYKPEVIQQALKETETDNLEDWAWKVNDYSKDFGNASRELLNYYILNLAKNEYNYILQSFNDNNDIYRAITSDKEIDKFIKDLQEYGTGNCWAKSIGYANSYYDDNGNYTSDDGKKYTYILKGEVTNQNIDWTKSIALNMEDETEGEIRLKANAPIHITQIILNNNNKKDVNLDLNTGTKYIFNHYDRIVNESIYHATMLKNGDMFEVHQNPTKKEFWDLLNSSEYKGLRGILCINEPIIYIWDAYYGTHKQIFDTVLAKDWNRDDYVGCWFDKNSMGTFGFSKYTSDFKEKYYGRIEDDNNELSDKMKAIFADDDLGLLKEDLEGLNRIAGFYWIDDRRFQMLKRKPEGVEKLDPKDNEFDYYHLDPEGIFEDNKVRFAIERLQNGINCYMEGPNKNACHQAIKAIKNKWKDIYIQHWQIEYTENDKNKCDYIDESIEYAESDYGDLYMVIYKNPTRQELKDDKYHQFRIVEDIDGNWYFGNAHDFIHRELMLYLQEKKNVEFDEWEDYNTGYNVYLYDYDTNTFIYRADVCEPTPEEEIKTKQEILDSFKYLVTKIAGNDFGNYKIAVSNEEEPWNDYNEVFFGQELNEAYVQHTSKHPIYGTEYNTDYIEFEVDMRFIDEYDVEWIVEKVNDNNVTLRTKNNQVQTISSEDLNLDIDMEKYKIIYDDKFYTKSDYERATGQKFPENI